MQMVFEEQFPLSIALVEEKVDFNLQYIVVSEAVGNPLT